MHNYCRDIFVKTSGATGTQVRVFESCTDGHKIWLVLVNGLPDPRDFAKPEAAVAAAEKIIADLR